MFKRIKELRIKNNYTISYLSNILKISGNEYLLYEEGIKIPSVSILSSLARFYNTSIDYLIEETDSFTPHTKN